MTLFLTSLDPLANVREFHCGLESIEDSFDFLSCVVAQGHILLTASVLDDMTRTNLPLAAFDGISLSVGINQLQQEWQAILSKPRQFSSIHREEMIRLTRQRIHQYEVTILAFEQMSDWFNQWIQRTQNGFAEGPSKVRLMYQYKFLLVRNQTQVVRVRFSCNLAAHRLSQLIDLTDC